MKELVFVFCLLYMSISTRAQKDTLYVAYENIPPNSSILYEKMKSDPDARMHFPFNGGASYRFPKKNGNFENYVRFHFLSWSLDGPWPYFDYLLIPNKNISTIDFKDRKWFDTTDYNKILETFYKDNPVIFLLDEQHMQGESIYLVRVIFDHTIEE